MRMHQFETKRVPVRGFTAGVLINVAIIAYGREPEFDRKAPGQMARKQAIIRAFSEIGDFREAARELQRSKRAQRESKL